MDIETAEKNIAAILSMLEKSSGSIVRELSIVSLDVSTFDSDRRQLSNRVSIELERLPSHGWNT